jgi:hypothetical protein
MRVVTRLERIISAKSALPDEQRLIFDDLFVKLKTDEASCKERGWTMEKFIAKRDELMRNLRSVAAA